MPTIREIKSTSELNDGFARFVDEVVNDSPDWAAAGLLLFVVTSRTAREGVVYYVAPRDSPARVGEEIKHVGRWERVCQNVTTDDEVSVTLHVVDRLETHARQ